MMSLALIEEMSRKAAVEAAKNKKVPFLVTQEDIDNFKWQHAQGTLRLPFPNIGTLKPKGFTKVDDLFCDHSGWGASDESALTVAQLLNKLKPGMAYAITEVGQFQLHLGEFKPSRRFHPITRKGMESW